MLHSRSARRLAASLLAVLPFVVAGAGATPAPEPRAESELHTLMEGLKSNLKTIATRFRVEGGREDCLAAVAEMQRLALAAKLQAPPELAGIAAEDVPAHREAFRREMNALCVSLLALEIELLDGDSEAAWARISGPLYQLREAAHEQFQPAGD